MAEKVILILQGIPPTELVFDRRLRFRLDALDDGLNLFASGLSAGGPRSSSRFGAGRARL
jgi:hypothetical protein